MKIFSAVTALSLGVACSNQDVYRSHPTGAGGSTGTQVSAGSSSSGGGGTGGGSGTAGATTGGSASCNPDPGDCPPSGTPDLFDACGAGQVELVANLVDFVNGEGPISCPITLTDVYNPGLFATTDLCGYIRYCITPGTEISFSAHVLGYIPTNFATLLVTQSTQIPDRPGIPMANSSFLSVLKNLLPDADSTLAMVVVQVQPLDPRPPPGAGVDAQACASKSGWQLWLVDGNGDPVDAGLAYLVSETLNPFATSTDPVGFAFFYNLDPGVSTVQPRGSRASDALPDGGVRCVNPEAGAPLELTGSVPVFGSEVSVIPYVVAAVGTPTDGGTP